MNKIIFLFKKLMKKNKPVRISVIVIVCLILLVIYDYFSADDVIEGIMYFFSILIPISIVVLVFYGISQSPIKSMFQPKLKQCPKCDSTNLNYVKPTFWQKAKSVGVAPWGKPVKTLNVCRDCGFSWEDR